MTLTRAPCELDTMSLFQDLKLKRRKVDSRCSSDGESVADTSTSSPDIAVPGSPCKLEHPLPSPQPPNRPSSPDSGLADGSTGRKETVRSRSGSLGLGGVLVSSGEIRVKSEELVFDGGGGGGPSWNQQGQSVASIQVTQHQQHQQQQQLLCRINGVRPELIGGYSPSGVRLPPPPCPSPSSGVSSSPHHHPPPPPPSSSVVSSAPPRPAPTVIMGEAGGVRTMVWSQPPPPPDQPPPTTAPTTSSWSPTQNQEETAAHLLLNLGQEQGSNTGNGGVTGVGTASGNAGGGSGGGVSQRSLNMERLWQGDLSQLPASQQLTALNLTSSGAGPWSPVIKSVPLPPQQQDKIHEDPEDEEQPMICMICEDKATGLHYGIITCEGCKGFFKRTVQNRRVYTCVADGTCEITKAQRNRCQYCRFKKCIEQGMVLQAVREDRMPGGRNSGAVYNLYKVKYKKHKKSVRNGQVKAQAEKGKSAITPEHGIPPHFVNGTILKTALTNPSEVVHLRQRLDNAVSSSRDRALTIETTMSMIQSLIDCDEFQDIATLRNLDDLLEHKSDLSDKLMQIGDSIVYKLVQWTKRLPFYLELPVEVHTRLLTHKWHELLVLTTSAYQAIHGAHKLASTSSDGTEAHFTQEVSNNLCTLQTCLTSMMGRPITMDQLRQDVGLMVEKITHVTLMFRRVKLTMQEYVCLKVIIMLNPARGGSSELETIQERYMTCLRTYVEHTSPNQPNRFHDLLIRLPEVQSAASLLLESKMFYVPFLLNSTIQR